MGLFKKAVGLVGGSSIGSILGSSTMGPAGAALGGFFGAKAGAAAVADPASEAGPVLESEEEKKEKARIAEVAKKREREKAAGASGNVRTILSQRPEVASSMAPTDILSTNPKNKNSILGTGF